MHVWLFFTDVIVPKSAVANRVRVRRVLDFLWSSFRSLTPCECLANKIAASLWHKTVYLHKRWRQAAVIVFSRLLRRLCHKHSIINRTRRVMFIMPSVKRDKTLRSSLIFQILQQSALKAPIRDDRANIYLFVSAFMQIGPCTKLHTQETISAHTNNTEP